MRIVNQSSASGAESNGVALQSELLNHRPRTGLPRYFNLLWDEDLDELREVLSAVRDRRTEVVSVWFDLYQLHFGDRRSLSATEFRDIFEPALLTNTEFLLNKDIDGYAGNVLKLGETLAEHHVPLQEIIAALPLFEEAAQMVFPDNPPPRREVFTKFDKLSHIRIILLVDSYSRSQWAAATRIQALELESQLLPVVERSRFHGLVGQTQKMRDLYGRIEAVGRACANALVEGESGTGKELVARAIHECGPASGAPFVPLNCAALPRELMESELFGHTRGAFTGAATDHLGLFRAADGGTLFLDEITEMGRDTQSKLLRAIQEQKVRPLGACAEIPVHVRLIASTNSDPEQAMQEGQLRRDLYYRLQSTVLQVPPLRDRAGDIPLLIDHFISLFNMKESRAALVEGSEDGALQAMRNYAWPGNVRELSNTIESAFIFGRTPMIKLHDLPAAVSARIGLIPQEPMNPRTPTGVGSFAEAERDIVTRALELTDGNRVRAARMLKISRKRLYAKISKYGLAGKDSECSAA